MIEIVDVKEYCCSYCGEYLSATEINQATQKEFDETIVPIESAEDAFYMCPKCNTYSHKLDFESK